MAEPGVRVLFYGSYMNPRVLAEAQLVPERIEVARLPGFGISIRPLANLVRSDRHSVFGILATATHAELERLYAHAREVLGGVYLPFPVLVHTRSALRDPIEAALCYIAPRMEEAPADPDYVDRIVEPAVRHGFPDWYVDHLRSFKESHS